MGIEQKLKDYSSALAEINKELEKLEREKASLIKAFEVAGGKEREEIAAKMQKSEEKFKRLYEVTLELSASVNAWRET